MQEDGEEFECELPAWVAALAMATAALAAAAWFAWRRRLSNGKPYIK